MPADVGSIGCGAGWSSISIARAYPNVRVDGYDSDEASADEPSVGTVEILPIENDLWRFYRLHP